MDRQEHMDLSARSTATRGLTPAAWAPSRQSRSIPTRSRPSAWRRSFSRRSAPCAPEARSAAACAGLMLTPDGLKVIDITRCFWRPRRRRWLLLLESDLLTVSAGGRRTHPKDTPVRFKTGSACCCVVSGLAGLSAGYGTGFPLTMDADAAHTFVAGAKLRETGVVTPGGRVAGVTAVQPTLGQAVQAAYERVGHVHSLKTHITAATSAHAAAGAQGRKSNMVRVFC